VTQSQQDRGRCGLLRTPPALAAVRLSRQHAAPRL